MPSLGTLTAFESQQQSSCLPPASTSPVGVSSALNSSPSIDFGFDSSVSPTILTGDGQSDGAPAPKIPKIGANNERESTAVVEDTLTCGSCSRDFSLSDIIKFIDHKVANGCLEWPGLILSTANKCKIDFSVEDKDDSDCCSCLDFDLSNTSSVEQQKKQQADTECKDATEDAGTTTNDLPVTEPPNRKTEENRDKSNEETSSMEVEMNQANQSPEKVKQADEEQEEDMNDPDRTVDESLEVNSTKSDDKENQDGNHQGRLSPNLNNSNSQHSISSQVVQNSHSLDSKKSSDSVLFDSQMEAASEDRASTNADTKPEADKPYKSSTSFSGAKGRVAHNHLCRHYRRLCKHFQRALLSRTLLSDDVTNPKAGETLHNDQAVALRWTVVHSLHSFLRKNHHLFALLSMLRCFLSIWVCLKAYMLQMAASRHTGQLAYHVCV